MDYNKDYKKEIGKTVKEGYRMYGIYIGQQCIYQGKIGTIIAMEIADPRWLAITCDSDRFQQTISVKERGDETYHLDTDTLNYIWVERKRLKLLPMRGYR